MASTGIFNGGPKIKARHTFKPDPNQKFISIGDAYDDEMRTRVRGEWADTSLNERTAPYLTYIKLIAREWPQLWFLSDFMENGTAPVPSRYQKPIVSDEKAERKRLLGRQKRAEATRVAQFVYRSNGEVDKPIEYDNPLSLRNALAQLEEDETAQLRLFVVEDLSRQVIESLGYHLKIEPAFFREHIVDYAWYNVRDPWRDPPNLHVAQRELHWAQIRFVRARYFPTEESFQEAVKEMESFNVFRRIDNDRNNKAYWDMEEAKVGLIRTRASLWMKKMDDLGGGYIGVLLLDPTPKSPSGGYNLWRHYRNWTQTPPVPTAPSPPLRPQSNDDNIPGSREGTGERRQDELPESPSDSMDSEKPEAAPPDNAPPFDGSLYDNFKYWAQRPEAFRTFVPLNMHDPSTGLHIPSQVLLHLICSEWLTLADYLKTRLNQIDWEIVFPKDLLLDGGSIDGALQKLHTWRRFVPLFREMLAETFLRIFHTPVLTGKSQEALNAPGLPSRQGTQLQRHDVGSLNFPNPSTSHLPMSKRCRCLAHDALYNANSPINMYRKDFALALSYMEEYQLRIDRLTAVVTAAISIEDSRRGYSDNKYLGRLTFLATIFIPFSFIASLFSMEEDVRTLKNTMSLWAEISVPLAVVLVLILSLPQLPRLWNRALEKVNVKFAGERR